MKYRETVRRNIERIEAKLKNMDFQVNRGGTREQMNNLLQETEELLREVKSYVEREPISVHDRK